MSETIKINAKLKVYTKGTVPTKVSQLINDENYISEAPDDGKTYARKDKEWFDITDPLDPSYGEWIGTREEFEELSSLEDKTYYVIDNTPELYIGSTSFTGTEEEPFNIFNTIYKGIGAMGGDVDIELIPINSKGVSK